MQCKRHHCESDLVPFAKRLSSYTASNYIPETKSHFVLNLFPCSEFDFIVFEPMALIAIHRIWTW